MIRQNWAKTILEIIVDSWKNGFRFYLIIANFTNQRQQDTKYSSYRIVDYLAREFRLCFGRKIEKSKRLTEMMMH